MDGDFVELVRAKGRCDVGRSVLRVCAVIHSSIHLDIVIVRAGERFYLMCCLGIAVHRARTNLCCLSFALLEFFYPACGLVLGHHAYRYQTVDNLWFPAS
jgi:hypothetical protein